MKKKQKKKKKEEEQEEEEEEDNWTQSGAYSSKKRKKKKKKKNHQTLVCNWRPPNFQKRLKTVGDHFRHFVGPINQENVIVGDYKELLSIV